MDLICGINPVIEALQAGTRHFDRLLVVKGIRNRRISEAIARASRLGVPLRFEARETLDRMSSGLPHQGVIAVVSAKPVMGLEDLLASTHDPGILVVLDGIQDPRNLGAILRTVEAAGVDGVLLPERNSAGLSETVARASAGAIEHVRLARIGNLVQALQTLKARGYWIVGFDGGGSERWDAVDYRRPVALVFGGEGRGIRRLVREHCDHLVALPVFGHVTSLNVSVAAGIALYEVVRQRGSVPSHVRPIPLRPLAQPPRILGPGPEDSEHDPGWIAPPPGPEQSDGEEEAVSVVRIDEDSWTGPTVLRHAGDRLSRSRNGAGRRRRGPKHRPSTSAGPRATDGPTASNGSQGAPAAVGTAWTAGRNDDTAAALDQEQPLEVTQNQRIPVPSDAQTTDRRAEAAGPRRRRRHRGRRRGAPTGDPSVASRFRSSGEPGEQQTVADTGGEPRVQDTGPAETNGGADQPSPPSSPGSGIGRRRRRRRRRRGH